MTPKTTNRRRARLRAIRLGLKHLLGGRCALCGIRRFASLEVDHVNGCTWVQKTYNTETRWYRYLREYRTGVKLRLLCRSCNGSENQWKHGTRAERTLRIVA